MTLKQLYDIENKGVRMDFIRKHREQILKEKKGQIKRTDPVMFRPIYDKQASEKANGMSNPVYSIVGNSVGFFDSHMDVSMRGSFNKTVSERGDMYPILDNHNWTPKSIIAKNMGSAIRELPIRDLNYDKDGTTEALVANISPIYDEKFRLLYAAGEIREHSIGLQYVKIDLAVDDPSDKEGYEMWQKYITAVINREEAEEAGMFFPVFEQKVHEISAVLFGSNQYTPTLGEAPDQSDKSLQQEPPEGTLNLEPTPELTNIWKTLN